MLGDSYRSFLQKFEIVRKNGKLAFKEQVPPPWIRFGNVAIPADDKKNSFLAQLILVEGDIRPPRGRSSCSSSRIAV